jgi:hypothetical protein
MLYVILKYKSARISTHVKEFKVNTKSSAAVTTKAIHNKFTYIESDNTRQLNFS